MKPLDQYSEVVDERRRWTPDWYTWLQDVDSRASSVVTNVVNVGGASSLVPTMDGSIILLGGNALYDFTIPNPLTLPNTFACRIVNNDNYPGGRAKRIVPAVPATADFPSFLLWPKQNLFLFNTTNQWHTDPDVNKGGMRWKFDVAVTFFVNPSGSDTNDGLVTGAAGAFQTMQGAYGVIANASDFNGFDNVLKLDDGTYTAGLAVFNAWSGGGSLTVVGNQTTPDNVFINLSAAGPTGGSCFIFNAYPGGAISIDSVKMKTTVANSFAVFVNANAKINLRNLTFDTTTSSQIFGGVPAAQITFAGPMKIVGSPGLSFASINAGAFLNANNQTITLVRGAGGAVLDFPNGFVSSSNVSIASVQSMIFRNDSSNHTRRTCTGDTNGTTTISNLSINTTLLDVGMAVTGTNIPAPGGSPPYVTVTSILSGNSVQISSAATGTTVGGTVKFEIATGYKYNTQVSSTVYSGTTGPDEDYLPGNKAGIKTLNSVYL